MKKIVMGIDPGLNKTGWGILEYDKSSILYLASGVIKTNIQQKQHLRLHQIAYEIDCIMNTYSPLIVSLEETFINNNATSSLKLGYVRGAIMTIVGKHGAALIEVKPNSVKKNVTGNGHADKAHIATAIHFLVSNIANHVTKEDEIDAIAIAYAGELLYR